MMSWGWLVVCYLLSTMDSVRAPPPAATPPTYSRNLEEQLRTKLWKGYSVLQRPQEKVDITVSLNVITINELEWIDARLSWKDEDDYAPIRFLFSSETYTWRPAMIIENSVEDVSIINDKNVPMRIQNTGKITWNPTGIFKVACEADTTYYPMDIQTCTVTLTPWAYTSLEVIMIFAEAPVDLTYYAENGEWELVSTSYSLPNARSRGGQSFSGANFTFKIRRRPMFHILNTLFPVVLMAVLSAMVFKLPVDSGEKIGFSLTVLLAYAVYLTLISENIPSTSVTICFLSLYLALILCMGTLSVICTIIVINTYFRSDEEDPMPKAYQVLAKLMARLTCSKQYICCFTVTPAKVGPQNDLNQVVFEPEDVASQPVKKENKKETKTKKSKMPSESEELVDVSPPPSLPEDLFPSWKQLAILMDKSFFLLFMTMIVSSSTCLLGLILGEWMNISQ